MDKPFCRGDYEQAVSRPGKFEGEQPYIPYLWEIALDEGIGKMRRGITSVRITKEDRERFPELKGKRTIRMREREDGFVVEC